MMKLLLVVGPQAVRETYGTGKAVGVKQRWKTPISVCVSDAVTEMGSAITSVRMVSRNWGPWGGGL